MHIVNSLRKSARPAQL